MELSFFNDNGFLAALLFIVFSIVSFQGNKIQLSLILLFIGSLLLGLFIARLDPFINLWDEQFHALVAKNLLKHPFKLVLIEEPVFEISNPNWSYCTVWLHKQPLFLWQIALSFKLFGVNELALRIPSVVMHATLVFFIYRTGKICISKTLGYYSALFFSCAYFPLEFITGFYATDHNDSAFFFYSFASFWALIEYNNSPKKIYLIAIGVLAGCAVLCKWLTGLLPYLVWFIVICYQRKEQPFLKNFFSLLLSFAICVFVFLPWQLFAYYNYPADYLQEMAFNTRHIFEPLEGHGGNYSFYYDAFYEQFGEGLLVPSIVLICFGVMIYFMKSKSNKLIVVSTAIITYLFFTFVATKMVGYVFVIIPFFIMGISFLVSNFLELLKLKNSILKNAVRFIVLVIVMFFLFNHHKIYTNHTSKKHYEGGLIKIKEEVLYKDLRSKYNNKKCMIFNCNISASGHIPAIFFTNYPSFDWVLNEEQIQKAKKLNYQLIAIDDGKLPEAVVKDDSIIKVRFKLN